MSIPHSSRRARPCHMPFGMLLLGLALTPAVQAQSYSYTVLKDPSGAVSCGPSRASMSEAGDVLATCEYPRNNLADILGTLLSGQGGPLPSKPVVWRGNARIDVLSGTSIGMLSNGQVLGRATALFSSTWSDVIWTGKTRANWKQPAGLSGTWRLLDWDGSVSWRGDAYLIYKSTSDIRAPQLGLVRAGAATQLPAAPAACRIGDSNAFKVYAVSNAGMVATLATWTTTNLLFQLGDPRRVIGYGQVCKWTSQGWQLGPALPAIEMGDSGTSLPDMRLDDLTEAGEVLLRHEDLGPVMWGTGASLQARDGSYAKGGANGELLGSQNGRAMMLRNGQAVDLNTQASLPADLVLIRALAANKKGQILCEASPAPGFGIRRTVVLTPK
jgi:hypothetical protein